MDDIEDTSPDDTVLEAAATLAALPHGREAARLLHAFVCHSCCDYDGGNMNLTEHIDVLVLFAWIQRVLTTPHGKVREAANFLAEVAAGTFDNPQS